VRADEKLTALMELESAVRAAKKSKSKSFAARLAGWLAG
jgi:hypothetical protein